MSNTCHNSVRVIGPSKSLANFVIVASAGSLSGESAPARGDQLDLVALLRLPPEFLLSEDISLPDPDYGECFCYYEEAFRTDAIFVTPRQADELKFYVATKYIPPLSYLEDMSKAWPELYFVMDSEEYMSGFRYVCQVCNGGSKVNRMKPRRLRTLEEQFTEPNSSAAFRNLRSKGVVDIDTARCMRLRIESDTALAMISNPQTNDSEATLVSFLLEKRAEAEGADELAIQHSQIASKKIDERMKCYELL